MRDVGRPIVAQASRRPWSAGLNRARWPPKFTLPQATLRVSRYPARAVVPSANSPGSRRAVVDVGSNSVLLLVAELQNSTWVPVMETTAVTGLGAGTKQSGLLSEEGMADTLCALDRARQVAADQGVNSALYGGTMALRIARNTDDFLRRAEAQGSPVTVISGEDEAQLGFWAVAEDPMFSHADRISIIDPGGHSTELVTADRTAQGWEIRFRRSYPVGALGLRESVLTGESPDFAARLGALAEIDRMIGLDYRPGQGGIAVVLGATGTNLISMRDRLLAWEPERVHGATLDYEEVGRAVGWLCDMTDAERAQIPGLEPGREKTIHGGALILERFLNALHVLDCRVSIRGWRHALLVRGAEILTPVTLGN